MIAKASQLQRESKSPFGNTYTAVPNGLLQRKCACGSHSMAGAECEECARKKWVLQRKLVIGTSNDPLEQEADRVAEQVMATPINSIVNDRPPQNQRLTGNASKSLETVPASVDHTLASLGRPLEPALRQDMEQRFGHDFSHVRVHTDSIAEQSANAVNARAYTLGQNIVFGAGEFTPETKTGRRLIAHELTHVVQQLNFPHLAQHYPVVQLERRSTGSSSILIRGRQVKELIRQRNDEIYALIQNNRFNNQYTEARRETINQQQHIWEIAIQWLFTGFGTGGRTVELPLFAIQTGTPIRHRIRVEVNPLRFEYPGLAERIPDPQQRLESMAAETLFHELVHALILIERALPASAHHSRTFTNFQRALEVANSTALSNQRTAVKTCLNVLVVFVDAFHGDATRRREYVDNQYESLINEKFAGQMAAAAFDRTRSNTAIARAYSGVAARNIDAHGTRSPDPATWARQVSELERQLYLLYEQIDGFLLGPPPEIIPRPEYMPQLQPITHGLIESLE